MTADLVVVGAGIVGLAHAYHAVRKGLRVVVVDRDARAVGASIRNFGHCCITVQDGDALRYAHRGRQHWLDVADAAGFWAREASTLVVARHDDEWAVLHDLAAARGAQLVQLLDPSAVQRLAPVRGSIGGALLPGDLRVDPRGAVPAIARYLADQGVDFHWSTTVHGVDDGVLRTNRGVFEARDVVVAVNHDVDRLFPGLGAPIKRCSLHMLQIRPHRDLTIRPAVLTGHSMLRYAGFAVSSRLADVRARIGRDEPEAAAAGLNLMFTQRPDGDLVIGDTHSYDQVPDVFAVESWDALIINKIRDLLDIGDFDVRYRWQGVYASATDPFLVAEPSPGVHVVSVTSGIGMTTSFGLAADVVDQLSPTLVGTPLTEGTQ
ncbi:FAD dependent oxidoreductase TIGR03364 [Branchiibius hedensis]|uniref:FAD dependent oxidoreductase TIGR03364 n=1 Tax=Branchiibius hedensis TaxID=672460 RepID=A0A2Y8ZQY0_9MICO|nr:TIGR03364 family FAD-dependent oxidoreductase [Branchiibius hedensis]PWJ25978.1 FAD dependent oxidoreductase TIGR03364 [Branchiibius hedensis]SSA34790.1 FAD dependent oxidoreductase TIGR03364 [Branchiibius hedensis]